MRQSAWGVIVAVLALATCARAPKPKAPQGPSPVATPAPAPSAPVSSPRPPVLPALVPLPALIEAGRGNGFTITPKTLIIGRSGGPEVRRVALMLSELCRRSTGVLPAVPAAALAPDAAGEGGLIELAIDPQQSALGAEGYDLTISSDGIRLAAAAPAGLFYGVQTLRQLLPYWGEYEAVMFQRPRPATIPALHIRDAPRYPWRGAMLDVARHFFSVDEVKRFVDLLALHKMNRLHLHLADDQGWRIEIKKWPALTAKGGLTEVGGGPGGFYAQAQYAELEAYAADRFITIVPEIDMPGHINAAMASYPELNCNGQAPPVFTGTDVGFSALCVDKDVTYRFIDDVLTEIAAMTKGPYFHMGGDEVKTLTPEQYRAFVERVQTIVAAHGKQMIGWDEVAATTLLPTSIVQHWRPDAAHGELGRAPHLILSPGNRAYLDMKYDRDTALGLNWAGLIPVKTAYDWDPATLVPEAPASAVLGVEAPLWTETLANMRDVEFLAMPRLAAIAELGWSPVQPRDWEQFRVRLGAQGPRWTALGINFYRAPEIPWRH
ncbi:MAG TPA: family 20 glycosylhydrolase [Vicinamibacterales bacterium]